jgi:hypothetical protein
VLHKLRERKQDIMRELEMPEATVNLMLGLTVGNSGPESEPKGDVK